MTIGIGNTNPELKFSHSSDGVMDLLLARKGNLLETTRLGIRYLGHQEIRDPLTCYIKVKKVVLQSFEDSVINMDGEVLPLSDTAYFEICNKLLMVYGEY